MRKQIVMDTLKAALQKNEAESSEIIHIILPFETAHQHHKISAGKKSASAVCEHYSQFWIVSSQSHMISATFQLAIPFKTMCIWL